MEEEGEEQLPAKGKVSEEENEEEERVEGEDDSSWEQVHSMV